MDEREAFPDLLLLRTHDILVIDWLEIKSFFYDTICTIRYCYHQTQCFFQNMPCRSDSPLCVRLILSAKTGLMSMTSNFVVDSSCAAVRG